MNFRGFIPEIDIPASIEADRQERRSRRKKSPGNGPPAALPEPKQPQWLRLWQGVALMSGLTWVVVFFGLVKLVGIGPQTVALALSFGVMLMGGFSASLGSLAVWRLRREETLTVAPLLIWLLVAVVTLPVAAACLFLGGSGIVEWFKAVL